MTIARRRLVIGVAATLMPHAARAQSPGRRPAHRIGWISTEAQPDPFVDGFREGLRRYGYVEGQNVILELRYTSDLEALRKAVAELTASGGGLHRIERAGDPCDQERARRRTPIIPASAPSDGRQKKLPGVSGLR